MNNYIYDTDYPSNYMASESSRFRPASVFNGCPVFKRNSPFTVFGECPEDSLVSAELFKDGKCLCTATERSKPAACNRVYGKSEVFRLILPAQPQGYGYELLITCITKGEFHTHRIKDICFGEVFVAGGQSNMEFELQNCTEGPEALRGESPDVRFYYTPKNHVFDAKFTEDENKASWMKFSKKNAKNWSAVGYFFARELSSKLGCPVGIIGCNWGGTSATAWMPYETIEFDSALKVYAEDYKKAIGEKSKEEQKKEWEDYITYNTKWQKKIDRIYKKNPKASWDDALKKAGECKYPGPLNSFNPMRPSGLFETMLRRIVPYTVSGFIYYQGESDDHRPEIYERLFGKLIDSWRHLWNDESLPFFFVQLPMHRYIGDPDKKNWCIIRNAQTKVLQHKERTGMAVALDCGAYNDIHPKKKAEIGHRLALQALSKLYGVIGEEEANSPIFDYCTQEGHTLILNFKNANLGFELHESIPDGDPNPPEKINEACFEVSEDGINWVSVPFVTNGVQIRLSSESIPNPRFVRYAYTNYGKVSVFSKNQLPLTPFECEIQ
ncbi:MAG: sialate O-acetylesterase [Lachnospiraceae bacterium]|nr:sialate O-acetylesterase [Lachnospiraceae bacterium]